MVTDHGKTVLGLPEVQLGLLPGSGGTQRLPRLIRAAKALDLMLTGKQVRARQARKLGLVDDMVPPSILLEAAIQACQEGQAAPPPGKRDLQGKVAGDQQIWSQGAVRSGPARGRGQDPGNYPAPERIIEVVRIGVEEGMQAGLLAEARHFGELVMTPESAALRSLLRHHGDEERGELSGAEPRKVVMPPCWGRPDRGGVPFVTATQGGVPVRIKDVASAGIGNAMRYSYDLLAEEAQASPTAAQRAGETDEPAHRHLDYSGLPPGGHGGGSGVRGHRPQAPDGRWTWSEWEHTVFAQHPSLPIHQIASAATHPEPGGGAAPYFSPVDRCRSPRSFPTRVPAREDSGHRPGVRPGRRADPHRGGGRTRPGFYCQPYPGPYMNEAARLVLEGELVLDSALLDQLPGRPHPPTGRGGTDVGPRSPHLEKSWVVGWFQAPKAFDKLLATIAWGRKETARASTSMARRRRASRLTGKEGKKTVDASVYDVLGVKPQARLARQGDRRALRAADAQRGGHGALMAAWWPRPRTATSAPSSASAPAVPGRPLPLHGQPRHRLSGGAPRAPSEALWRPLCPHARLKAMAAEQQRFWLRRLRDITGEDGPGRPWLCWSNPGAAGARKQGDKGLNLI